jgi:low affinity Fe/Cu permease
VGVFPLTHATNVGQFESSLLQSLGRKENALTQQTFKNHMRLVPPFHFFVLPVLVTNFIWSICTAVRHFSPHAVMNILTALAILLGFLFARLFVLTVQDRLIRLEELLRFQRLLPADLQSRLTEFTRNQFVALRFASDEELPTLARQVLSEKLNNRKAIKLRVKTWRPDYFRA